MSIEIVTDPENKVLNIIFTIQSSPWTIPLNYLQHSHCWTVFQFHCFAIKVLNSYQGRQERLLTFVLGVQAEGQRPGPTSPGSMLTVQLWQTSFSAGLLCDGPLSLNSLHWSKKNCAGQCKVISSLADMSPNEKSWMFCPFDIASLGWCIPWTMHPLNNASFGLCISWWICPFGTDWPYAGKGRVGMQRRSWTFLTLIFCSVSLSRVRCW